MLFGNVQALQGKRRGSAQIDSVSYRVGRQSADEEHCEIGQQVDCTGSKKTREGGIEPSVSVLPIEWRHLFEVRDDKEDRSFGRWGTLKTAEKTA